MQYTWSGYNLVSDRTGRSVGANLQQEIRPARLRWLGHSEKGNALLGGLSIAQERRSACGLSADGNEGGNCKQPWSLAPSTSFKEWRTDDQADGGQDGNHPQFWGRDPVFQSESSLYQPSMAGQESAFYNTASELSPEGLPYMWTTDGRTSDGDYSLIIDNNVGAARVNSLWRTVDEGRFMDQGTAGLVVSFLTFNPVYRVFGYVESRYSWDVDGSIHVESRAPTAVPILVSVLPLALQGSILVCFTLYTVWLLVKSRKLLSFASHFVKRSLWKVLMVADIKQTSQVTSRANKATPVLGTHEVWDVVLAGLIVFAFATNLACMSSSQHIHAEASYKLHDAPQSARARYVASELLSW